SARQTADSERSDREDNVHGGTGRQRAAGGCGHIEAQIVGRFPRTPLEMRGGGDRRTGCPPVWASFFGCSCSLITEVAKSSLGCRFSNPGRDRRPSPPWSPSVQCVDRTS